MVDASDGSRHGDVRICDFSSDLAYSLHTMPLTLAFHRMVWGWDSDGIAEDHHKFFKFISLQRGTVWMLQHRATAVQPSNRR